jgi:hypothetical protein
MESRSNFRSGMEDAAFEDHNDGGTTATQHCNTEEVTIRT